jgi:type VI secretion system protein ImpC
LDDRLSSLNVQLENLMVTNDGESMTIKFREMEDFDPDRLFEQLGIFSKLRSLRRRVQDPATVNAAVNELAAMTGHREDPTAAPLPTGVPDAPDPPNPEELLDQMLEESETNHSRLAQQDPFDLSRVIGQIVSEHAVARTDPRQTDVMKSIDKSISMTMVALLRHPAFRQLESTWRGIEFLVRGLELGTDLKLYLIDVSQDELQADLLESEDLTETGTYQLLVEQTVGTPGGQPWSLLVGNYYFGNETDEISALGRMAKLASQSRAPFITSSNGSIIGCERPYETPHPQQWAPVDSDAWRQLRALTEAKHLSVLWPRFLLRLPYGRSTRPTDRFDLEEVSDTSRQHLLWGHPALLAAKAIGQEFSRSGWDLRPGESRQVADLPVWVYENQGEKEAHPCTELLLSQRGIEIVESTGIVPIIAVKGQDTINIPSLCSVAGPILF